MASFSKDYLFQTSLDYPMTSLQVDDLFWNDLESSGLYSGYRRMERGNPGAVKERKVITLAEGW